MKRLMSLFVVLFVVQATFAQEATIDPHATSLLDKMNKQFEGYAAYEMDFKLSIKFPEAEKANVQRGKFIRKGTSYRVISGDQKVYSNGEYVWIYKSKDNEVQITDADDTGDDFVSPDQLFNLYKTGNYIYRVSKEFQKKGRDMVEIEFKPTDNMNDFFKIKMVLDKGSNQPQSVKIYYKDGLRVTTTLTNLVKNKSYGDGFFVFDKSKFSGVKIEDLRL